MFMWSLSWYKKEREEIRVHKFLFGLDVSRFRNIRSQIIDEDPLPDINNAYSRVIREEQHNNSSRATDSKTEAIGFSAQTESPQAAVVRPRDPNRVCSHCSRKGHDQSECFLLHGYPEWWNDQPRNNSGGSNQRGRGGRHNSNNCGRGRSSSNRVAANNATINNDHIAQIIQLLQSTRSNISTDRLSGKTKFTDIIIDTGASHYMTGNLSLLSDVSDILPSSVKFSDGRFSRTLKKGTLVLSRDCSLHDVLYVPDFN